MRLRGIQWGFGADLPNVIHPINSGAFELWTEVSLPLGHHNGFVTQNALEDVKVPAGHHPVRGERVPI
jgi:hypothetical protein